MNFPPRLLASVLLGSALVLRAADEVPQGTVIDSDTLSSQSAAAGTTTVYTGHVVVTSDGMRMNCDKLEVITAESGDKRDTLGQQDQFKYLLATGEVHIVQGLREATCGRAEVLPQENKITLTENPVVTDHSNNSVITGEKLILLKGQRLVLGEHVHMTGPPIKNLGLDKTEPAPSAGTAQQP